MLKSLSCLVVNYELLLSEYLVCLFPPDVAVWLEGYDMINISSGIAGCPIEGMCCVKLYIDCFSWIGGSPLYKQSSAEFSTGFRELEYFLKL